MACSHMQLSSPEPFPAGHLVAACSAACCCSAAFAFARISGLRLEELSDCKSKRRRGGLGEVCLTSGSWEQLWEYRRGNTGSRYLSHWEWCKHVQFSSLKSFPPQPLCLLGVLSHYLYEEWSNHTSGRVRPCTFVRPKMCI